MPNFQCLQDLTLTWDVFKSDSTKSNNLLSLYLTLTWDVFKSMH